MSKFQQCVAAYNGAVYAAPYVRNSLDQNAQEAIGVFFGGNSPDVHFQSQPFGQTTGPTTAFSTTVEARRWDHVINSFLIMEKMHEHQQFPLLLAPLELAKGMTFTTRIFTSNLDPPEEAPEHVPAPFSTTQWSETKTALTMVHRSVKFSLHELKTEKGQQDYKVHLSNLALMFLRDTHNVVLRKFARQTTLMQALLSFFPPNKRMHRELMHNIVRNFGQLNTNPAGLDALVANIKQIGTTQNVNFDTCVVPYGSLSNMALSRPNFVLTDTMVTLSQNLAKMADITTAAKIPTHVFQNEISVFQYQKNADQIQNPENDPMSNTAVVATYHPFGSDRFYMPGSRDIQVISASANGWATLKFKDAIQHLDLPVFDSSQLYTDNVGSKYNVNPIFLKKGLVHAATYYGEVECLWDMASSFPNVRASLKPFTTVQLASALLVLLNKDKTPLTGNAATIKTAVERASKPSVISPSTTTVSSICDIYMTTLPHSAFAKAINKAMIMSQLDPEEKNKLALFALMPTNKEDVIMQLEMGINFPFEVAAVRPFIELETANAIFCKRGRETAVTYCLPPWTFIGRDNRIEMVDMKFGFWRECHIERPANIIVAEHAFVNRVKMGMDVAWMKEQDYMKDPMTTHRNGFDVFPIIMSVINPNMDLPALTAISHNLVPSALKETYAALNTQLEAYCIDVKKLNSGFDEDVLTHSPTLWHGDALNKGAIPRLCALGTTRQSEIQIEDTKPVRYQFCKTLKNKGHMKELDSEEWIGSLCGFANSQLTASSNFF